MRKILTSLFVLINTSFLTAQVSSDIKVYLSSPNADLVSPPIGTLVNGDSIHCQNNSYPFSCNLKYVNTSPTDTYHVALRRYVVYDAPGATNAMTYGGINYPPGAATTMATTNVYNDSLYAEIDYFPSQLGEFTLKYHFFNTLDSTDYVEITIYFLEFEGIEECSDLSSSAYPNPTTGSLKIEMQSSIEKGELMIYDQRGKKCGVHPILSEQNLNISTEYLLPGNYYFLITNGNKPKYRGQFIKL